MDSRYGTQVGPFGAVSARHGAGDATGNLAWRIQRRTRWAKLLRRAVCSKWNVSGIAKWSARGEPCLVVSSAARCFFPSSFLILPHPSLSFHIWSSSVTLVLSFSSFLACRPCRSTTRARLALLSASSGTSASASPSRSSAVLGSCTYPGMRIHTHAHAHA